MGRGTLILRAQYVPVAYSCIMAVSYVGAVLLSTPWTLWPAAVRAQYPSRPFYQIGAACALLPHIASVALWYGKDRSLVVLGTGSARFALWLLLNYITQAEDAHLSGLLAFLYTSVTAMWMAVLLAKSARHFRRARLVLLLAYGAVFLLGLHQLARQLRTGFGQRAFYALRAAGLVMDFGHEYLARYEFDGVQFAIDWVQSMDA